MNKQNAFRRGFTLIELMIVIVILGILMGTILPRLTGAQARARDTARKADLTNISQALEVFYGDTGAYPIADATPCLDPQGAAGTTSEKLASYLKGKKMPKPPSNQQNTLGCIGMYYYKPLFSGGVGESSYVLASDMETWQLANYKLSTGEAVASTAFVTDSSAGQGHSAQIYINRIGPLASDDATNVNKSIFIVIP